jgi:hypothetical protein
MLDRLGLAGLARDEIVRWATAEKPPGSVKLRYHTVACFGHLGELVRELRSFVAEFETGTREALDAHRSALRRIEVLAAEAATRPGAIRICGPERAAREPASPVELDEDGIGPAGQRREWLPVPELATALLDDATAALEAVARATVDAVTAGRTLDLDLRVED